MRRNLPYIFMAVVLLTITQVFCGCGKPDQQPNIVFVVLDTVRDDFTGLGDSTRPLTPNLTSLAQQSTVFKNAWANSPWTVPSHASFFTGHLSSGHGCTHQHPRLDTSAPTLAELLSRAGYQTAAFFSNPWLSDRTTGLLRGFAVKQQAPPAGGIPNDPGRYRGDQGGRASVFSFRDWLQRRKASTPFFVFVNFLEAHLPYDPPPDLLNRLGGSLSLDDFVSGEWGMEFQAGLHPFAEVDWQRLRNLYAGDVMSTDRLLGGLLRVLESEGLLEQTILIIASDHGENLGDHGLVDHQFSVHETLLAVPLLVKAPGSITPGERNEPVMLTDLFATVVDFAGLEDISVPASSRSLVDAPAPAHRPLFAEYARPQDHLLNSLRALNPEVDLPRLERSFQTVRVGDLRLTLDSDGGRELYNLAADPAQDVNLADTQPEQAAALQALIERLLPVASGATGEKLELDEQTRKQLRSLGYVH
jgi:arylsulfatase A-like enzyme